MYRYYDFKCKDCGSVIESLENIGTEEIRQPCSKGGGQACLFGRVVSVPRTVKIDVDAKAFVPSHVKRARNLGHGGSNARDEGSYSHKDTPMSHLKKLMVGPLGS
jgi:hypothetical protein